MADNLHPFEDEPRVYGGYLSDSVYRLLTRSTLPKETSISNGLSRMEQIPRVVAAARANLRRPSRPLLETAIRQSQGSIAFYEKDIFEFAGKTPELAALRSLAPQVIACLEDYQAFPEGDLLPRATGDLRSVTKLAPRRLVGQMMGVWFLATSLGNLLAGLFAGRVTGLGACRTFCEGSLG